MKWSTDSDFLEALNSAISSMKEFKPDIVAVSAWFDGYHKDRLLEMKFSLELYKEIWKRLSKNFENIFAVLEWGYHYDIKECIDMFVDWINYKK